MKPGRERLAYLSFHDRSGSTTDIANLFPYEFDRNMLPQDGSGGVNDASKGVHCWSWVGNGLADRGAGTAIGDTRHQNACYSLAWAVGNSRWSGNEGQHHGAGSPQQRPMVRRNLPSA
jgi:hypothetical protein